MTREILNNVSISKFELILIPGFVQWDTTDLENEFSVLLRKGPEFASDIPIILSNLDKITLSNKIPANKLMEITGERLLRKILHERIEIAKNNLNSHTFYINQKKSDILIGHGLPPPIIAEVVNCTQKTDKEIIKKVTHYINSGADIIDIGCIANKPEPERVEQIINLLKTNFNVLLSIDSMNNDEILAAVDKEIDLILSFDLGNYKDFLKIPKDIPIVLLPTKINEGYFPKDPETRVKNLFKLTKEMQKIGFTKLIADPLLETPISPGICNSLQAYFLYKEESKKPENESLELPLFFGISNVVELMDIDSIGINGLLSSIALELDIGILFTVEHSSKLMGGVKELKESVYLNYVSKCNKTPPINQGIQIFRAKGKVSQILPIFNENEATIVKGYDPNYIMDKNGYFKIYVNHYTDRIYVLFFSNKHQLLNSFIGNNAEALSKNIIDLNLTNNLQHINYLGRQLAKAEFCLFSGKPYIQDE